jgi:transcriptional regulator with XRE-family HTH domain
MKVRLNVALKAAIFESRKKQKRIAKLAGIAETQLSHVVRGRRVATPKERARLAAVLGKSEAELFTSEGAGNRSAASTGESYAD